MKFQAISHRFVPKVVANGTESPGLPAITGDPGDCIISHEKPVLGYKK